jgi:mannose-6-phosphate isomerase-like protein (cupin superfamily)
MNRAYFIDRSAGDTYKLGIVTFKLLVGADQTDGVFALGEFAGEEGPWTVLHVHENTEEAFYILDGTFTFSLGDEEVEAGSGSFILVRPGMPHVMRAHRGGGRFLTLWTPGGLEAMFVKLGQLPPGSISDPEVRKRLAADFDSKPLLSAST